MHQRNQAGQDRRGEGRIVEEYHDGWVRVTWDCEYENDYRAGKDNCYDLLYVDKEPVGSAVTEDKCTIGLRVRRGPDWDSGDVDGRKVGEVVGDVDEEGRVEVKWEATGECGKHCVGAGGQHELVAAVAGAPGEEYDGTVVTVRNHHYGLRVVRGPDW